MTSGGTPPTLPLLLPEGGSYPPPMRCTACGSGVPPAGCGPAAGDIGSSAACRWSSLRLTTAEGMDDRVEGDATSLPAAAIKAASSKFVRAASTSG